VSSIASARAARPRPDRRAKPGWTCPDCGNLVTNPKHVRCGSCIGNDPQQAPVVSKRRARAISNRRQAEAEFERLHPDLRFDPRLWPDHIRPALADTKLSVIMAVTNVTKSTASSWRTGRTNPHISHLRALMTLAGIKDGRQ
jgi:hypothetical protein